VYDVFLGSLSRQNGGDKLIIIIDFYPKKNITDDAMGFRIGDENVCLVAYQSLSSTSALFVTTNHVFAVGIKIFTQNH